MRYSISKAMGVRAMVACVCGCLLFASCLGDDNNTVELTNDCYIASVSLGNMRRLVTVKTSDGSDSIARQSYSASSFAFRIDQINHVIYNPEYLPHNVQLDAARLNISASGTVMWRKRSTNPQEEVNNQDWVAYSSTDSVDVRDTIILRVYSYDGTQQRDYKLKVNRYDRDPDSLYWRERTACEALARFESHRSMMMDGELCVVGRDKDGEWGMVRPLSDDAAWQAYDGELPQTGMAELDALMSDIEDGREHLPTRHIAGASIYAGSTPRYVLAGGRDEAYGDTCAVVWIGTNRGLFYCTPNNENEYALPALKHLQVVNYKGRLAAIGGEQLYGSERTALGAVYVSRNYGLTWDARTKWATPKALRGRTEPLSAVACDSLIYVVSGTQVWEAR